MLGTSVKISPSRHLRARQPALCPGCRDSSLVVFGKCRNEQTLMWGSCRHSLDGRRMRLRGCPFEHLKGVNRAIDGAGLVERRRMASEHGEEALPEATARAVPKIRGGCEHQRVRRALHRLEEKPRAEPRTFEHIHGTEHAAEIERPWKRQQLCLAGDACEIVENRRPAGPLRPVR